MHIFDRICYICIPLYTTSTTDGLVEAATCRRDIIHDKWLFLLLICAICWIKYYILLPHNTVGNHNQCCTLAVSFLSTSWGATICTKCFHDTVCYLITGLPSNTHKYTLCCPSALYMHPANIIVFLKRGGTRNPKYIEEIGCGLQKWYLFTPVLRCHVQKWWQALSWHLQTYKQDWHTK